MKPLHGATDVDFDDLGIPTPADDAMFALPPSLDPEPAVQPAPGPSDTRPILGVLWRVMRRRRSQHSS